MVTLAIMIVTIVVWMMVAVIMAMSMVGMQMHMGSAMSRLACRRVHMRAAKHKVLQHKQCDHNSGNDGSNHVSQGFLNYAETASTCRIVVAG